MKWVELTLCSGKPTWVNLARCIQIVEGEFYKTGEASTRLFGDALVIGASDGGSWQEYFTIDVRQTASQILAMVAE